MSAASRNTLIPGLATCQSCGFEARGSIRKIVRAGRSHLSCDPCARIDHDHAPEGDHVSVWAPETSQAALVTLVRTAHVILHLHGAAFGPTAVGDEFLDLDFSDFPGLGDDGAVAGPAQAGRAVPLVVGARRVLVATTQGRSLAMSLVTARLSSRPRTRSGVANADEMERRLAHGIRVVPRAVPSSEVERWIEGGGTYAGWTAETLAAQLS